MRDGLYRACEAYLNGAINEFGYALLLSKYDDSMISLVAIDGLTGTRAAAQVALGGEATGKASGEQSTSTPVVGTPGPENEDGSEAAGGAAPAATVMIKDSAESSAKVTTVQFSTPAGTNLDASSLGAISPQITEMVKHVTQAARRSVPA